MNEWEFEDNKYWWDPGYTALKFDGVYDGERYVFAVSQIALNDYFQTADTKEMAIENYLSNSDLVENVAGRFATDFNPNDDAPHYFITYEIFCKYAP